MQIDESVTLSIIVPHFNSADLLVKLLSTIPDIPQIEVIVVDDHSTQRLEELLNCKKEYANRNIYFLENKPDRKSAGAARNVGIKHAKGKYLLFADADDWFLEDFWSVVQENIVDEDDVIFFAPTSRKINGREAKRHLHYKKLVREYLKNISHQNELKLRYLYWSPCSKLIKRSVVLKNKVFFDEVQFANDLLFSAKVGNAAKTIKASEDIIYCILEHRGSLITYKDEASSMMRRKVYCRYYFYLRSLIGRNDFRLLGFTSKNDWNQIKFLFCALWYDYQHGIKCEGALRDYQKVFEMAWKSFVNLDKKKNVLFWLCKMMEKVGKKK